MIASCARQRGSAIVAAGRRNIKWSTLLQLLPGLLDVLLRSRQGVDTELQRVLLFDFLSQQED